MNLNLIIYSDYTHPDLGPILTGTDFPNIGNTPASPSISLYQIDYLLIHFDEMIRREIQVDADIIYNPIFQQFYFWVLEFNRIVLESRANTSKTGGTNTGMAIPPFGKGPAKAYTCNDSHRYSPDVATALENAINIGVLKGSNIEKLNPKIYYDFTNNTFKYGLPDDYYGGCRTQEIMNLVIDVIRPTIKAWNAYDSSTTVPPEVEEEDLIVVFNEKFNKIIAETNDQIKKGDYESNYDIIEVRLKDTGRLLDTLAAAANTEENIIEQSADVAGYYEKLNFTDNDVDPALKNPTDSVDMVDMDLNIQKTLQSIQPYSNPATGRIIALAQGLSRTMKKAANIGTMMVSASDSLNDTNDIIDPPQELKDLMQTSMYKDDKGDIIVKALTKDEQDQLLIDEIQRQQKYLSIIKDPPDGRLEKYEKSYVSHFFTGGNAIGGQNNAIGGQNNSIIKYKFKNPTTQTKTISRSGGREIGIQTLMKGGNPKIPYSGLSESDKIVSKTINEVAKIEDLYKKQNEQYFENVNFMDIENLNQRNTFLIEMMNIIILHKFLIADDANTGAVFMDDLGKSVHKFKSDLTELWDVLKSRSGEESSQQNVIINKLLANGFITKSQIDDLIKSIGIMPVNKSFLDNPMLNSMSIVKILSSLQDIYGLSESIIVHDLGQIIGNKIVTPITKTKSVNDMYNELFTYYQNVKSLNNKLRASYENLENTTLDLNRIINITGDVIENNISTANTFNGEMITVIKNFSMNSDNLAILRKEINKSKFRFSDFKMYMKDAKFTLQSRNILEQKHDNFITLNPDVFVYNMTPLKDFYDTYVTQYVNKLEDASNNITKYYSYDRDFISLNYKRNELERQYQNFNIISYAVYQDYQGNNLSSSLKLLNIDDKTVDVSKGFNNLANEVYTNFFRFMRNQVFPIFPKLFNRIDIPAHLSDIMNELYGASISRMKTIIDLYLPFNGNKLKAVLGFTRAEQIDLVDNLVGLYRKYIYAFQTYNNNAILNTKGDTYTQATYTLNKLYKDFNAANADIINASNNMERETKIATTDLRLKNLIDYMDSFNPAIIIKKSYYIDDIEKYLNNIYEQRGYNTDSWDQPKAELIRNDILSEMRTLASSIFNLFNAELKHLYELYESYSIVNNTKSPHFNAIAKDAHDVEKLDTIATRVSLIDAYDKADFSSVNTFQYLKPRKLGNLPAPPAGVFTPIDYTPKLDDLYNAMNKPSFYTIPPNYAPQKLLDLDDKRTKITTIGITQPTEIIPLLKNINQNYKDFEKVARPILSVMKEMINNNQNFAKKNFEFSTYELFDNVFDKMRPYYIYDDSPRIKLIKPSTILNKKDVFIIQTNYPNLSIIKEYEPGEPYSIYIPSYIDDDLKLNTSGTKLEYTINNPTKNLIHLRNVTIPKIDSTKNLTVNNLEMFQKLLNTGKLLASFTNDMIQHKDKIKNLNIEDLTTWGTKRTTKTDAIYNTRLRKKNDLRSVLSTMSMINNSIKEQFNEHYDLDMVLIDKGVDSRGRIMFGTVLPDTINQVDILDPMSASFNNIADRIWIFTRMLYYAWYTIFAHMLSSFILNLTVNKIIELINLMETEMNLSKVLEGSEYKPFVGKVKTYHDLVMNEISLKSDQLENSRLLYPVEIDPSKPAGKNTIIKPVSDEITYSKYYTNTNAKDIYLMQALIKNPETDSKFNLINKALKNIEKRASQIVDIVNIMDKYLDTVNPESDGSEIINDILIPPIREDINTRTDPDFIIWIEDLLSGISGRFTTGIEPSLITLKLKTMYADINRRITALYDSIIAALNSPDLPPPAPMPNNNRYIHPFVFEPAQFNDPVSNTDMHMRQYQDLANSYAAPGIIERPIELLTYFMTDIYRITFDEIKKYITNLLKIIDNEIELTKITALGKMNLVLDPYLTKKDTTKLIFGGTKYSTITGRTTGYPNANGNEIKFILYRPEVLTVDANEQMANEINDVLYNVSDFVGINLQSYYQKERNNFETVTTNEIELMNRIRKNKSDIQTKIQKIKNMINIITEVMFNQNFKNFAFMDQVKLMEQLSRVLDNFETIKRMLEQKIRSIISKNNHHLLTMGQINNYEAFKSAALKLINNKYIVKKFYKRMSFGLIEYYLDILDRIIKCLESNKFEDMTNIQVYLYKNHYIQLKRCHILFQWIRYDYQNRKQAEYIKKSDTLSYEDKKKENPLSKKIEITDTTGDVQLVFNEFHALRRYLDDYSAVQMEKVQLHLRINDFASPDYNDQQKGEAGTRDVDKFLDVDDKTESKKYIEKWEKNGLMFINGKNGNKLRVNFDLLNQISTYNNPGTQPEFDVLYKSVFDKMEPPSEGITFQRIYNKLVYPESDVISNYMSIAPNINNGKGTVIMTYGYSGVGKSASLFGMSAKGSDAATNGILQATLDQFSSDEVDIYFRVYEIYGLGTQNNFYWNPENSPGNPECYPNFYQCIIHYVLDNSNPNAIKMTDRLIFTNRHDMLAYILDLKDPARNAGSKPAGKPPNPLNPIIPGFKLNNINDISNAKSGDPRYFNVNMEFVQSSYIAITESQYRGFKDFSDNEIEKKRSEGVSIKRIMDHLIQQVKGTINNPNSSRSILVYDFQINTGKKQGKDNFVPFLIYDLPGKEDINKTYVVVDTNLNTDIMNEDMQERTFRKIDGDGPAKQMKSTYVLNPILIPIFPNNWVVYGRPGVDDIKFHNNSGAIRYILKGISHGTPVGSGFGRVRINATLEANIVRDILSYNITNFKLAEYDEDGVITSPYDEGGNGYRVDSFYTAPFAYTFEYLVDDANIDPKFYNHADAAFDLYRLGITAPYTAYEQNNDQMSSEIEDIIKRELMVLICIVIMAFLIKYNLFDIIAEIIMLCADPTNSRKDSKKGRWSISKIYAFAEAFYINENVVGLLEYLISDILGKEKPDTGIEPQYATIQKFTLRSDTDKNFKTGARYRAISSMNDATPTEMLRRDYGLRVTSDLLDAGGDKLKEREIVESIENIGIQVSPPPTPLQPQPDPEFANPYTITSQAFRSMENAIPFENKGKYSSNKIFRKGTIPCAPLEPINNPGSVRGGPATMNETNRPLLQDFIEPYREKISFFYVFYVVSNGQMLIKAEEQVKLLNNSMPFVEKMDPSKQESCPKKKQQ